LWLIWVVAMTFLTAGIFRWHFEYFRNPGPQFFRIALIAIPALTAIAWIYAFVRRAWLWKWEPHVLLFVVLGACLFYEPRVLVTTVAIFLACSAAGGFLLRQARLPVPDSLGRITLGLGAGAGIMIAALFVAGTLKLFYFWLFIGLILAPLVLFWRDALRTLRDVNELLKSWRNAASLRHPLAGIAIVFGFVAAVCALMLALAPSIAFDPVAVHLPSIQFYLQLHALRPVTGIDYSYFPQGFEMLWTWAYALAGQPAAQLMSALFFPLFLLALARLARDCGLDHGATIVAIVCAATLPFLHWSGSAMKNDLALAFFELLALGAFLRWLRDANFRWIVSGTFFLAQAFGIKHVALFGAVPLALLFGYAISRQSTRLRAVGLVIAVFVVFGTYWTVRTFLLTRNPAAPARIQAAAGAIGRNPPSLARRATRLIQAPAQVLFHGLDAFESPLPNPAGILFFAFAPLALLGSRLRPATAPQLACAIFAAIYLLYWAAILIKVRYAIAAFGLLAVLIAAWMKAFYDHSGKLVQVSVAGSATYCFLIAWMGLMIVDVNGPQFGYFSGRLDKPGYLRSAMQAYGAVDSLRQSGCNPCSVFGVENLARAYAPDPYHFQGMWCPQNVSCSARDVTANAERSGAEYLILPEDGKVPTLALDELGNPQRIYRDAYFSVYHLSRKIR